MSDDFKIFCSVRAPRLGRVDMQAVFVVYLFGWFGLLLISPDGVADFLNCPGLPMSFLFGPLV